MDSATCPCCGQGVDPLDVLMDTASGIIAFGGRQVYLTPLQFRLVRQLVEAFPATIARTRLFDRLYDHLDPDDAPEPKIVDIVVCKIRRKLAGLGLVVTTSWGVGYAIAAAEGEDALAEGLKTIKDTRCRRATIDKPDVSMIRQMKRSGLDLTEIAARLRLTYRAVTKALDQIDAEDRAARGDLRSADEALAGSRGRAGLRGPVATMLGGGL